MTRLLLVDDHQMMRQGLRALLGAQPDMQVVAEADNGRQAIKLVEQHQPAVVVMDLHLPELNGADATRQALAVKADMKVVCISADANERAVSRMLEAGASAFVMKESAFEDLVAAIHAVMRNHVYLSPGITDVVVNKVLRRPNGSQSGKPDLSSREREVLQLIAEGRSAKEIAHSFTVSVKTIETHRRNIMEKLRIDNVAGLTKFAIREGLTSL